MSFAASIIVCNSVLLNDDAGPKVSPSGKPHTSNSLLSNVKYGTLAFGFPVTSPTQYEQHNVTGYITYVQYKYVLK